MTQNTSTNTKPIIYVSGIIVAIVIAVLAVLSITIKTTTKPLQPIIGSELTEKDLKYTNAELQAINEQLIADRDEIEHLFIITDSSYPRDNMQMKIKFDKFYSAPLANHEKLASLYKIKLTKDVFTNTLMQQMDFHNTSILNNPNLDRIIADTKILVFLDLEGTPTWKRRKTIDLDLNFDGSVKDYIEGLFHLCVNSSNPTDVARAKYLLTQASYPPSYYNEYASAILGALYATDARIYANSITPDNNKDDQTITKLNDLAQRYLHQAAGNGIPSETDRGIAFLIGAAYQSIGKDLYAVPWYEKSLDSSLGQAYGRLSLILIQGKDVPVDYNRAHRLAEFGASRNNPLSYYVLGMLYEKGLGVTRDMNKANSYYAQGCALNNKLACEAINNNNNNNNTDHKNKHKI